MPVTPRYPGVYIQEIPSGVRTITGVATSTAAFVGRTARGPVEQPVTVNSFAEFERVFGGLWLGSKLGYAVRDFYLNGGSQAVIVRLFAHHTTGMAAAARQTADAYKGDDKASEAVKHAAGAMASAIEQAVQSADASADSVLKAAQETRDDDWSNPQKEAAQAVIDAARATSHTTASGQIEGLQLEAANPGAWGKNLQVQVDDDVLPDGKGYFNLAVTDTQSGASEKFINVSINPDESRAVDKILANQSSLLRVSEGSALPTEILVPTQNDQAKNVPKSATLTLKGGSDGGSLTADDFTGPGKQAAKAGLYALENAVFNLLCIPPYLDSGDVDVSVVSAAAAYVELRRAMLLVDAPSHWSNVTIARDEFKSPTDDKIGTRSKNAALFFPRLRQPNPLRENQFEDFAPCGAVAGVIARTDTQRGLWKAPAGLDATLVGVPQLSVPLTDAENGQLNPLGINCLRAMPGAGRVVWGARTLQGDDRLASEWKYIPVRRLALYIEESLYRGTQWVVFEPNDEPLWAQIRLNVGAFMHELFRQGAFQGQTVREAYFVKCDHETTTQTDINNGVVNILVGFAPLKPAEFVIISLQQMAGQIQA